MSALEREGTYRVVFVIPSHWQVVAAVYESIALDSQEYAAWSNDICHFLQEFGIVFDSGADAACVNDVEAVAVVAESFIYVVTFEAAIRRSNSGKRRNVNSKRG